MAITIKSEFALAGCTVAKSATQSVNSAQNTPVSFDVSIRDDGGFHNNVVNNSRMTVPPGGEGWYITTGLCYWDVSNVGMRGASIVKNGVDTDPLANTFTNASSNGAFESTGLIVAVAYLVAGDFIELWAYQNSGAPLDLTFAVGSGTVLSIAPLT